MSKFLSKVNDKKGFNNVELHPDYKYITTFGILNLEPNIAYKKDTQGSEFSFLVLDGSCTINVNGKHYGQIVSRDSVFSGLPYAFYAPINSMISLVGAAKIAVFGGRCEEDSEPTVIGPQDIKVMDVGKDNWQREVRLIIGPEGPSVNTILGETLNPPGNWSGIPPHKHEVDDLPEQSKHEEIYYFKTDKPQGWGIERIYSQERKINEILFIEDNSVTFMPWGYHQVASAPGYTLYYSFFLAGVGKKLAGYEDQDHCWIKTA